MARELDNIDRRILDLVQSEVPLVPRPFAVLAERASVDEQEVIRRIQALKETPRVIRQISAIFDSHALGYRSSLVAARIDPSHLDDAAAIVSRHPGVSHNYHREHEFNLWYTVAVPPDSRLGLERTIDVLHRQNGAISTRLLPTLTRYKIGVRLDLSGENNPAPKKLWSSEESAPASQTVDLTEADKSIIRIAQADLPIAERPFDLWADEAGCPAEDLLEAIRRFERTGKMRRFSAVLRHREAGFSANGMGTWIVPKGEEDRFGATAAAFPEVSHCYLRPTYPDWPYNLFTMVHAQTNAECEAVIARISEATGVKDFCCLYSTHEYKKVRVKYFTPEIPDWEEEVVRPATIPASSPGLAGAPGSLR
jgi:DNA-binding Lrp family transcriptional regulator